MMSSIIEHFFLLLYNCLQVLIAAGVNALFYCYIVLKLVWIEKERLSINSLTFILFDLF